MKKSESFFEKIAYLFYAVADADGSVHPDEFAHLHQEIISFWKKTDQSAHDFDTDGGIEVEAVFEWLEEEGYRAEDALSDFKIYAEEHPYFFDAATNELLLHTCREIAFNFKKINKSEAKMLEDIEQFLGGISSGELS